VALRSGGDPGGAEPGRRPRAYLRFMWSHEHRLHRLAVRVFNAAMRLVPFGIKYGIGRALRASSLPYSLVESGSVVVQIGAPKDTLYAGRARAIYFSLFAGQDGKVVIVEPNTDSLKEYEATFSRRGMHNAILCPVASWSERKMLTLYISDSHPASSFTKGTKDYDQSRLQGFRTVEMSADTIDNILAAHAIQRVDLVSITTNGAEQEILRGMRNAMAAGLPYISLARTGEGYLEIMNGLGYDLYAHDDRGYTFKRRD